MAQEGDSGEPQSTIEPAEDASAPPATGDDSPAVAPAGGWPNLPRWVIASAAAGVALLLLAGGFIAGTITAIALSSGNGSCDAKSVADRVLPTIVTIVVESRDGSSNGSGQIITSDGYILTNNHVVSPAVASGRVAARFSDGQLLPARIVGRDPKTDLAVIKVDSDEDLPVIDEGDSGSLSVGQPVVALGAPLGLSSTVTAGIVSALGRTVPVPSDDDRNAILVGAIQTDASINPGNSGGALVDCRGRLIGVNTAIATVPGASGQISTGSVGIGFAVPQSVAVPIAHQLIEHGEVTYPNIGADLIPIPHAVAAHYGVPNGLFVQAVTSRGPADAAGIRPGDVITSINGQPATSLDVLTHIQLTSAAGDTITVDYLRGRTQYTTTVTLAD
ncbi:S1C family serine protease [Agromyces allii]|uniref:PDZ domain-containing protein n=1 Tax=Agromyces allii TaxID=393607 RepID=A0ABP5C032_9MICO|nr:trypsin-like peptidase domain-containing protein [Agromyces allii]